MKLIKFDAKQAIAENMIVVCNNGTRCRIAVFNPDAATASETVVGFIKNDDGTEKLYSWTEEGLPYPVDAMLDLLDLLEHDAMRIVGMFSPVAIREYTLVLDEKDPAGDMLYKQAVDSFSEVPKGKVLVGVMYDPNTNTATTKRKF